MCGIAGHIGPVASSTAAIKAGLRQLHSRGPDASGSCVMPFGRWKATVLHTRLSIIDLDPRSDQPFESDDCVLVFNGEVYNHLELRSELAAAGHVFRTTSDTEVVIKAWREWGEACFQRFEGMWALALVDKRLDVVLLSRDRFGEKPLFVDSGPNGVTFASDVATLSILSGRRYPVNVKQIRRYLVNGYKSLFKQPDTFFEGVSALPTASFLCVSPPSGKGLDVPPPQRYWSLSYNLRSISYREAVEGVRERLGKSIEMRLRADVPLAFCLSGGVDSSTLAAYAVKHFGSDITTFSIIDSDERYNEVENIETNVEFLGCRHHYIHTSTEGFLDRLAEQSAGRSAPVATISYYVHDLISEAIRSNGFKVAVSGTAGDELFTGYYDHYNFWLAEMSGQVDFNSYLADWHAGLGTVVRNPVLKDPQVFVREPGRRDHIYGDRDVFNDMLVDPLEEDFSEESYCESPLRNRMFNELFHETVPVLLQEDDSNSMRHSVENRSPFLDSDLAEFLFSVPTEYLVNKGAMKALLREAGAGIVPDSVRLDKVKKGFNASIDSLLDRSDSEVTDRLLAPGEIFDIVDRGAIEDLLDSDLTGNNASKFMFSFISARLFMDAQSGHANV